MKTKKGLLLDPRILRPQYPLQKQSQIHCLYIASVNKTQSIKKSINSQQISVRVMITSLTVQAVHFHRKKKDHRQHKRIATFKDGFWDQEGGSSFTLAALHKKQAPNKIEFSRNICSSNEYIFDSLGSTFSQKERSSTTQKNRYV